MSQCSNVFLTDKSQSVTVAIYIYIYSLHTYKQLVKSSSAEVFSTHFLTLKSGIFKLKGKASKQMNKKG